MQNGDSRTGHDDCGSTWWRGGWCLWLVATARVFHGPGHAWRYHWLHQRLGRAERVGEITECHALTIQGILAMSEPSEFAIDYFEMAAAVASSTTEQRIIAEVRAAHDWLQRHPPAGGDRVRASPPLGTQSTALWQRFTCQLWSLSRGSSTRTASGRTGRPHHTRSTTARGWQLPCVC
jgi:hypothetical protein